MKNTKVVLSSVLAVFLALLIISSSGCNDFCMDGEKDTGNVIKQERPISSFNSIRVSSAFEVILSQGDYEKVVVEANENLMDNIKTEVKGSKLIVSSRGCLKNHKTIKIYITFKNINSLYVSGAVEICGEGKLNFDVLDMDFSGASEIEMDITANKLSGDFSGASEISLSGKVNDVKLELSGASELKALELEIQNFDIEISGAAEAKVYIKQKLNVDISGAAEVRYLGDPVVTKEISGAGSVTRY